jgi:Fe-S-cluster containining protein
VTGVQTCALPICCDLSLRPGGYTDKAITLFKLNKWIAYRGKTGQERAEFCREFIKNKRQVIETIQERQQVETQLKNETISCHHGCVYCCYHYVTATFDEVEAIVYYLYQNGNSLQYFLESYPGWKSMIEKNQTLINSIAHAYNALIIDRESPGKQEQFHLLANQYLGLDLPCPFLRENECVIYPVRPWVCASWAAVTPPEWCSPQSLEKPRTISISYCQEMNRVPHYRKHKRFWTTMPKAVFSILQGGIYAVAKIPGLETLARETMEDPEVKVLIKRLIK